MRGKASARLWSIDTAGRQAGRWAAVGLVRSGRAYADWGAILGLLGASAAALTVVFDVRSLSLCALMQALLASYEAIFHLTFRILDKLSLIDGPEAVPMEAAPAPGN